MKKRDPRLSRFFKVFCLSTMLTACPATRLVGGGGEYTWVGGVSNNSMKDSDNWDPNDGPPGGNDDALFPTTSNPPFLLNGDDMEVNSFTFEVTGVTCTLEGALELDEGVFNQSSVSTMFNIQNEGSFLLSGGSLQDGGASTYNVDSGNNLMSPASLFVASPDVSSCSVNLSNGGFFNIQASAPCTIGLLSSSSSTDSIFLQDDLVFGDSSNQTIAGVFSGTGNLTKQGSGTVKLSGTSTFSGVTSVNAGRLNVNGVVPGNILVGSGATVGGSGSIGGLLTIAGGGILSPGNSIGTLTVDSLSLSDGSTTVIEIDPTTSSEIIVSGSATLGGAVSVVADTGAYNRTGSYKIVEAATITNSFSGVSGSLSGYQFFLTSTPTDVFLNYQVNMIPTEGLSGNILKVADYLNEYSPLSAEYFSLAALSGDPLEVALTSVSPARNAFSVFASQQTAFSLSRLVSDHLSMSRLGSLNQCTCCDDSSANVCQSCATIWLGGYFQHAHEKAQNQNPAFHFQTETGMIGCDWNWSANSLVGAGLGYAHSHLSENEGSGNANIDYYFGTLYGSYTSDCFYLEPAVWGIYHRAQNHRRIVISDFEATAKGSWNGWQLVPHLELGFELPYCWGILEPYVAADWVVNWEDSYAEHGASSMNMRLKAQTSSMLQSQVGLRFYEEWMCHWGCIGAKEEVSYVNRIPFNTGRVTAAIVGSTQYLTLKSLKDPQNLASVNFGLFAKFGECRNLSICLEYNGEFGSVYQANEAMAKISLEF